MKIVVSSLGESIESPVDQRFGRARYFILCDLETGSWSVHNNGENLGAAMEAGIQAAQLVIDLGADAVITGHCGPRAFAALAAGKLEVYEEATGTVKQAIEALRAGELDKSDAANVEAGFGIE